MNEFTKSSGMKEEIKHESEFTIFLNQFSDTVNQLSDIRFKIEEKVRILKNLSTPEEMMKGEVCKNPEGVVENCFDILHKLRAIKNSLDDTNDQFSRIVG